MKYQHILPTTNLFIPYLKTPRRDTIHFFLPRDAVVEDDAGGRVVKLPVGLRREDPCVDSLLHHDVVEARVVVGRHLLVTTTEKLTELGDLQKSIT